MLNLFRKFGKGAKLAKLAIPNVKEIHRGRGLNEEEAWRNLEGGQVDEAEKCFAAALEEKINPGKRLELTLGLAEAQRRQAKLDEAEVSARTALILANETKNHGARLDAMDIQVDLCLDRGDLGGALALADEIVHIEDGRTKPDPIRQVKHVHKLACVLVRNEQGELALAAYARAAKQADHTHGPNDLITADILSGWGALLRLAGRHPESQQHLRRAMQIHREARGADSRELTADISELAASLEESGDVQAAMNEYEKALSLRERQLGADPHETALLKVRLGALYLQEGRSSTARELLIHAIRVLEKGADDHYILAMKVLAYAEEFTGRSEEAKKLRDKADKVIERRERAARGEPELSAREALVEAAALTPKSDLSPIYLPSSKLPPGIPMPPAVYPQQGTPAPPFASGPAALQSALHQEQSHTLPPRLAGAANLAGPGQTIVLVMSDRGPATDAGSGAVDFSHFYLQEGVQKGIERGQEAAAMLRAIPTPGLTPGPSSTPALGPAHRPARMLASQEVHDHNGSAAEVPAGGSVITAQLDPSEPQMRALDPASQPMLDAVAPQVSSKLAALSRSTESAPPGEPGAQNRMAEAPAEVPPVTAPGSDLAALDRVTSASSARPPVETQTERPRRTAPQIPPPPFAGFLKQTPSAGKPGPFGQPSVEAAALEFAPSPITWQSLTLGPVVGPPLMPTLEGPIWRDYKFPDCRFNDLPDSGAQRGKGSSPDRLEVLCEQLGLARAGTGLAVAGLNDLRLREDFSGPHLPVCSVVPFAITESFSGASAFEPAIENLVAFDVESAELCFPKLRETVANSALVVADQAPPAEIQARIELLGKQMEQQGAARIPLALRYTGAFAQFSETKQIKPPVRGEQARQEILPAQPVNPLDLEKLLAASVGPGPFATRRGSEDAAPIGASSMTLATASATMASVMSALLLAQPKAVFNLAHHPLESAIPLRLAEAMGSSQITGSATQITGEILRAAMPPVLLRWQTGTSRNLASDELLELADLEWAGPVTFPALLKTGAAMGTELPVRAGAALSAVPYSLKLATASLADADHKPVRPAAALSPLPGTSLLPLPAATSRKPVSSGMHSDFRTVEQSAGWPAASRPVLLLAGCAADNPALEPAAAEKLPIPVAIKALAPPTPAITATIAKARPAETVAYPALSAFGLQKERAFSPQALNPPLGSPMAMRVLVPVRSTCNGMPSLVVTGLISGLPAQPALPEIDSSIWPGAVTLQIGGRLALNAFRALSSEPAGIRTTEIRPMLPRSRDTRVRFLRPWDQKISMDDFLPAGSAQTVATEQPGNTEAAQAPAADPSELPSFGGGPELPGMGVPDLDDLI